MDQILARLKTQVPADRPHITLSYAQSLDGCIAVDRTEPLALSCKESLEITHRLRAAHTGILVGISTVIADNPSLTTRLAPGSHPIPIILDSRLRMPLDSKLLDIHDAPIVLTTTRAFPKKKAALEAKGVRVITVEPNEVGYVSLRPALKAVLALGVDSILVEGGARVLTSFLRMHLVDQLLVTVAPVILGGVSAVDRLPYALSLKNVRSFDAGCDLIICGEPA